jgi:hypothetical protein
MKTQTTSILPKIKFVESDGTFNFLKGKNLFAEKHARAKEALSKMKIPENWTSK